MKGVIATQFDLEMLIQRIQKVEDRPDPATHVDSLWKRIEQIERDLLFVIGEIKEFKGQVSIHFQEIEIWLIRLEERIEGMELRIEGMELRMDRMETKIDLILKHLNIQPPSFEQN